MDDVDDILDNERTGEDDIPEEDEEGDVDEEGDEEDEDNGDEDDNMLLPKNSTNNGTDQSQPNEDDDDDDEDDDDQDEDEDENENEHENESGGNENGESEEVSNSSDEANGSKNEDQSMDNQSSQGQKVSNNDWPEDERGQNYGASEVTIGDLASRTPLTAAANNDGGTQGNSKNQKDVIDKKDGIGNENDDIEMADVANGTDIGSSNKLSAASKLDNLHNYYTQMLRSAKIADSYNVYPTAAIPIQTDVNTLAMSKGLKYLFLGGSDGFIRKYDFLNTMDGKLALTILQKHSLAESIQNAGIMLSYWENEIPQKRSEIKFLKNNKEYEPKVSPVYALEVQSECLFLLSGLNNGGITLQGVRYMEGSVGHYFKGRQGHTNVVNLLRLNGQEDKFLSGSWDKKLLEWDLQTGDIINEFRGGTSEYSSLEMRPLYSTVNVNDVANQLKISQGHDQDGDDDMGSLFGDDEEEDSTAKNATDDGSIPIGSSHVEEISKTTLNLVYDESVFMTSGLNGSVSVWDRHITEATVINLGRGSKVSPWCQSACWSMDGDFIYAGRRNAVVEEFDLKMPSKPSNTLKLPGISGPVSCVKTMPNNRQILCASRDNIRIYDTKADFTKGSTIPFLIVPGHHGGSISNLYIDPTCRFLISTSGNRGWQGNSTDTTFIYEIDLE